ncbi:MAG: thiamine-phosphate kinase [Pseudomonadota bacterium]
MRESDWIHRYITPLVTAQGAEGLRDDVALLSATGPMIVTMDTLVERTHFLTDDPLETVGQKLVRVNVSDIFVKGAEPSEALLSVAWSNHRHESEFEALISGLGHALDSFGVALIGGDLVGTEGELTLTLTLTGRCLNDAPVRRSGGGAGQSVLMSGEIGWGGLGLQAAKTGALEDIALRYRIPQISSLETAKTIAKHATASLDVSDGLLIDAARLAEASGCGVEIRLDSIPLAKATENIEEIISQCVAGDDYCALISADPGASVPGFHRIGELTSTPGLHLSHRGRAVKTPSTLGFEH